MSETAAVDADDELLVAYLDGELPREQRAIVEDRLSTEESLRLRMQALQRSWDMLDWLPSPPMNERSVETTLQLVVADLTGHREPSLHTQLSDEQQPARTRRGSSEKQRKGGRRFTTPWRPGAFSGVRAIALPLLLAAIVFGCMRWWQLREVRSQIADFPIAMDMDAYAVGKNTELIEELMKSDRWTRVVGDSMTPGVDAFADPTTPHSLYREVDGKMVLPDREPFQSRLDELPSSEKIVALSRWERFNRLDEDRKRDLRETALRVRSSENPAAMRETMRQYARFRQQLSRSVIAGIENETGIARETAMDAGIEEVVTSIGRATGRRLSEETIERIDFTVIKIVKNRLQASLGESDDMPPARRLFQMLQQRVRRSDDSNAAYRTFALVTLLRDPESRRGHGRGSRAAPLLTRVPPITAQELEMIHSMLPSEDQENLQRYGSDPWIQSMILRDWAVEATRQKMRGRSKPPTLAERYENLPEEQRELLDLSPPEKARKTLMGNPW